MLGRILTVAVCSSGLLMGTYFISKNVFGPMFFGTCVCLFFGSILVLNIWDWIEQSMNKPRIIVIDSMSQMEAFLQEQAEMRALNTPDPHLVHPDDLKRQASGHDDYPTVGKRFNATILHREGEEPKIIDIKV
jgi:hypothetical protein